jgi:hypothetical protein
MLKPLQLDSCWSEGLIALKEALFCLDCEIIFAGMGECPRCGGEGFWPLAQWLSRAPAAQPATACVS